LVRGEMGGWEPGDVFAVLRRGRGGREEFAQPRLAGGAVVAFCWELKGDEPRGNRRRDCQMEEEEEGER
jgi:hypothetical protein